MASVLVSSTSFIFAFIIYSICVHNVVSQSTSSKAFNPSILQDSRDLPQTDGTFGFLYRTEDGIAHAAKGDSNGQIHGRFTYTDPTGLKVNYNYNAGSRVTPGYNYNDQPSRNEYKPQPKYNPAPQQQQQQQQQQPRYEEQNYDNQPQQSPQYDYQPRYITKPQPQRPAQAPIIRSRPPHLRQNEVNDDYRY